MSRENIELVEKFVKEHLSGFDCGHDWWHISRVRSLAVYIQEAEKMGDRIIIELGALLHDIGDSKFRKHGDEDPEKIISDLLRSLNADEEQIAGVVQINRHISFSSGESNIKKSNELMIVQDADRLDAIGAIGIARAFSYGGFRNNPIYLPDDNNEVKEGPGTDKSTIAHFYDKLLKLKDMMNTGTGKKIAEDRHRVLEDFLEEFYQEWNF